MPDSKENATNLSAADAALPKAQAQSSAAAPAGEQPMVINAQTLADALHAASNRPPAQRIPEFSESETPGGRYNVGTVKEPRYVDANGNEIK